jgi:hypothetical protein
MADANAWKSAAIAAKETGTSATVETSLVAAVTDKHIRVKAIDLTVDDAAVTDCQLLDGASGSVLIDFGDMEDNDIRNLPPAPSDTPAMWCQTSKGTALILSRVVGGTAADLCGVVVYTEAF